MDINFFEQGVPYFTTLLHFQHLLEEHEAGRCFLCPFFSYARSSRWTHLDK